MGIVSTFFFLVSILAAFKQAEGMLFGKGTFTVIGPSEFQCKSFAFNPVFTSSEITAGIHVQITLFMTDTPGPTYEAAVGWVEVVTASGFTACVETSGGETMIVTRQLSLQWMAFSGNPGNGLAGQASVPLFTAGTQCVDVDFTGVSFDSTPYVFATAVHMSSFNNSHDAMSVWAEGATQYAFKICLRELKNFDGIHDNIRVEWLALQGAPAGWTVPVGTSVTLPNTGTLTADTHYSFCQDVSFTQNFYSAPVLITTALHTTSNPKSISPDNNAITEWIESVEKESFKVCMKDIQPYDGAHDPVDIEYLAIGYLDPCIPVSCDFYATCKAFGPKDARCECPTSCENYEDMLCGENNVTYTNRCYLEMAICNAREDIKVKHPGPCFPFILHRGRVLLTLETTDVQCKTIPYSAPNFLPDYNVHVQASINYYFSNPNSSFVHDAAVVWTENVNIHNFTVCALKAGRLDRGTPDSGKTFVDYIAYQGSPVGAAAGIASVDNWWDGTKCKDVTLPTGKFSSKPYIVTSATHGVLGQKHDAATTWVEDVTTTSFRVCLRELQNFDGLHSSIRVNWLAYQTLPDAMNSERTSVSFTNDYLPPAANHNAFCKTLSFSKSYSAPPTLIVTSGHSTAVGGVIPEYNSIASWVEYIDNNGAKICVKELHTPNGYDPVLLTSLIVGV